MSKLPSFPYGAVYFRKSNPPREDWATDYATAAADGMNTFRHWFLWGAIETAPGQFDWADYDRQLDLATEHGLVTIIAEMITCAPEWAFRQYAHARYEARDGRKVESTVGASTVVGGFPGLCLDNDDARKLAEGFLRALVLRYRDHPGLGGYDIWNECSISDGTCYCAATAARFRAWLGDKYGDLRALGAAWHRPSYVAWEDVTPPRDLGPYPHVLDWLQFRADNAYRLMRWRVDLIRSLDSQHPITAHGVAGGLTGMASHANDDWRAAAEAESYGLTWVACRKGAEPWKQFHAVDLVRAASRGKRFWHAEAQGGPLWMQPQVIGRPREDGRIPDADDVRCWHLVSFMCGATGLLYPRWRPLLDGPLFGAFGPYAMDGSRTPRSEMASHIARWVSAPEQKALWRSRPVRGDLGIVVVPETQLFTYAQQGNTAYYAQSLQGAYQGFFDNHIQADWVRIDHIDDYDALYLPYPVMLSQTTADRLKQWVAAGGTLVAEGCPAYWGDNAHVGVRQPNLGLDELFGARENYVEFTPDLLGDLTFSLRGMTVRGGLFLQAYEPTTGQAVGYYDDGRVAAVENAYGRGRARLVGTMAGWGYHAHPNDRSATFFADALRFAGKDPHVWCSQPRLQARLHAGEGETYLWVANPARQQLHAKLRLSQAWGPFSSARSLWGADAVVSGREIDIVAGARDVAVLQLT